MRDRSETEWERALFPEAAAVGVGGHDLFRTLSQLDLQNAKEARSRGFIRVHTGRGGVPSLWVHQSKLDQLQALADGIAHRRLERARRLARHDDDKRARIERLVDRLEWRDSTELETIRRQLTNKPLEAITEESLEELVIAHRLESHLRSLDGVRRRGDSIVVPVHLVGALLGRHVETRASEPAIFDFPPSLRDLLLGARMDEFRAGLATEISQVRALGEAALLTDFHGALASAEEVLRGALACLDDLPETRRDVEARLLAAACTRLAETAAESAPSLRRFVEQKARQLVWSALQAEVRDRSLAWTLAGDAWHPAVTFDVTASVDLLGNELELRTHHRKDLPRPLRTEIFSSRIGDSIARISDLVDQLGDAARARLEDSVEQLESIVESVETVSGFDIAALRKTLVTEFATVGVKPRHAVRRIRAHVAELKAKALETRVVHALLSQAHFSNYAAFFEAARSLDRRLVLYVGPTNSGKTFHALNALAKAESGVYLAPLRLLALEGQEELQRRGRLTSFLTGEERDLRRGARFVSSTIEMLDTTRMVESVVIDEVQLLSDPDRGWAWSAAIIGAPARNVLMTGSPDAVPMVQALAEYLGEPLEVRRLERFTPLVVLDETTPLSQIEPGTALLCFSRRDVLGLKQQLESQHAVSVIYGNLSPQVRREEARRFRSGETNVLVATDAIALGLNLPIRTVLFTTTWKWNGREEARLSPNEVRQIGGRAGRFGKHDAGFIGALGRSDLEYVRSAVRQPAPTGQGRVQVRPSLTHVEAMSEVLDSVRLRDLLDLFRRRMRFDASLLSAVVPDELLQLAALADSFQIPLRDKFTFACAPIDTRNVSAMHQFGLWTAAFARGKRARIEPLPALFARTDGTLDPEELFHAESRVKLLTVYAWLAYRYPGSFPDLEECDRQRMLLNTFIEKTLRRKGRVRRCTKCGAAIPPHVSGAQCERCTQRRRRRRYR